MLRTHPKRNYLAYLAQHHITLASGHRVIDVQPDGNCCSRAVCHSLNGSDTNWQILSTIGVANALEAANAGVVMNDGNLSSLYKYMI
jgi:hypothetical protein